jgi:hypothetical protein
MRTLRQFATGQAAIPPGMAWYLSDLGVFRGTARQAGTLQAPVAAATEGFASGYGAKNAPIYAHSWRP